MCWDIGRIADRNAAGAVNEQVGDIGRQHGRLGPGVIIVRTKIDGVFIDVRQQRFGQLGQPGLGVPHGGGRIAVHRSVVPLAVHEEIAHVKVLRHPNQRVVDRRVTVGVVVPHDLADDLGGLAGGPVVDQTHLVHAV